MRTAQAPQESSANSTPSPALIDPRHPDQPSQGNPTDYDPLCTVDSKNCERIEATQKAPHNQDTASTEPPACPLARPSKRDTKALHKARNGIESDELLRAPTAVQSDLRY